MRDSSGSVHIAVTSAFGYYHFDDVEVGSHVMSVEARKYCYETRIVDIKDEMTGIDFVPTK